MNSKNGNGPLNAPNGGITLVPLSNTKPLSRAPSAAELKEPGYDEWSVPDAIKANPFFLEVGKLNILDAIRELDKKMRDRKLGHLISSKNVQWIGGSLVSVGQIGCWNHNGRPSLSILPGSYWNFNPTIKYMGTFDLTSQVSYMGFTMAQVGQSEAMVVLDPQNRAFVIRNGGFVSYGLEGKFRIVEVVDTLDLGDAYAVKEKDTGTILGWKRDVMTNISVGTGQGKISVATFFNVPANNVVIVQQNNKIFSLGAGQHVITNPHTTFRAFFSLSERQFTFKTQPAYTTEGVPVILHLNLRYRVIDPIRLSANYNSPLQALINPCQTVVNAVIARLSYQQFMKAKKLSGDVPDNDISSHWITEFKNECLRELVALAGAYGVLVESFEIMDRQLEGQLGLELEKQAERVLQNQIKATQIELENNIRTEQEKGVLAVAQIQSQTNKTKIDNEQYSKNKEADSEFYRTMKKAEAAAQTSELETLQNAKNTVATAQADAKKRQLEAETQAKNIIAIAEARAQEIRLQTEAYASVPEGHAQIIQLALLEVEKRKALPKETVWFEGQTSSNGVSDGYLIAKGASLIHPIKK